MLIDQKIINKILEENKDLTYSFVKDILISLGEVKSGEVEPYKFGQRTDVT